MAKPIVELKNFGRSTHVVICGMDLSKGLYGVSFDQSADSLQTPRLTMTVDVKKMLQVISEITPEQLDQAKEIIKPYLIGYERADTNDGSSSMEVLR